MLVKITLINFERILKIRKFLATKLKTASVDSILIERTVKNININITSAKPGVIIGRGGQGVEELKKRLNRNFWKSKSIN